MPTKKIRLSNFQPLRVGMPKYRKNLSSRNGNLRDKVFGNSLIRENILNFVIHDGNNVSPSDVQNCRLVQKSWLESVNICLRRSREPVFHFHALSTSGPASLQKIADAVTKSYRLNMMLPPIKVVIDSYVFETTNTRMKRLILHLPRLSEWLVSLHLEMPHEGCPDPSPFTDIDIELPNLKEFRVRVPYREEDEELNNFANSSNLSLLIQSIFLKCPKLESFIFDGYVLFNDYMPMDFEKLKLPKTLTNLKLLQALNDEQLANLMGEAVLPRMSTLTITLPLSPLNDNQLPCLLKKFSNTLKKLTLVGLDVMQLYDDVTVIQVPVVMENLERITIDASNYKWSNDAISVGLSNLLPNLRFVTLLAIPTDKVLWRQWTETSRFLLVEDLSVEFLTGWGYHEHFSLNASSLLCQAFPNVVKLDITIEQTEIEGLGLQYVFRHMTQLTELSITVLEIEDTLNCHSRVWDSIILAIPFKLWSAFGQTKRFRNSMESFSEKSSSLLNLTSLQKLRLRGDGTKIPPDSLISDLVFELGFLNMPNLQQLEFAGAFKVSRAMAEKWKLDGRILNYWEDVVYVR